MTTPIVFLCFANQQEDRYLELLKKESSSVNEILRHLEKRRFIQVKREESADTQDVISTISDFPDQISIFHYGGHAGDTLLEFEDGEGNASGLAKLLSGQTNMKLVFLNGCSTKKQVDLLLKLGIKAVIATSVKIPDPKAVAFATAFYKELSNRHTIKRAFEFAKDALEFQFRDTPEVQMRSGGFEFDEIEENTEIPWGLYYLDENQNELNWTLPYYSTSGLPQNIMTGINNSFEVNKEIVKVLDDMCKYNKDIYSQLTIERGGQEVNIDSSKFLQVVIKNFPWAIGSQMQLLIQPTNTNLDRNRLEQLLSTYILTGMVLYYIILSDFWENVHRKKLQVPKENLPKLNTDKNSLLTFDFLQEISRINDLMQQYDCEYYVPELEGFCAELKNSDSLLSKAKTFLDNLRKTRGSWDSATIDKNCKAAEPALSIILKGAAFLAYYKMLTVRNISIDNPRYSDTIYEMNLGELNAFANTGLTMYNDPNYKRKNNYSSCKSIVLAKNESDVGGALNLSPFIVDINTYLDNKQIDLYLFGYKSEDEYFYFAVKHSIFIALEDAEGTDITDTSLTFEEYQDGNNINKKPQVDTGADDFLSALAQSSPETATATVAEGKPVFPALKAQFRQFESDFS